MYSYDEQGLRIKKCPKCGETKNETQWSFKDKEHTTFASYCKDCDRVRKTLAARERFKDRDKRKKENHRQRLWLYGLTQQDYEALLKRSDNSCEICNSTENLVIDHCHGTKKVRGILCWSCNVALGHFKDSADKLKNAHKYLCTHQHTQKEQDS